MDVGCVQPESAPPKNLETTIKVLMVSCTVRAATKHLTINSHSPDMSMSTKINLTYAKLVVRTFHSRVS